ncbi:hypothetical protein MGG_09377 [Pyricularia oryzae 70-15]|uniref:Glycoside hydrolase 131 catalytic N-terminal domain-containing protein n=3 Tax=Pyricularia oryzae TaxID=318829 RepID=G4NI09_PYRO7|nr:uncharacterized protein MGG_09377 [Pyricularia oryzae 70-15]EHA47869.1 hypothetical protein MGG_09377 [Pyricularia oryzae 70-15]ELQ41670.1 hypothetical protein OOU_Y34scaffold00258g4 [Pyricularia oryzae Y34]KAI7912695.1 hypothetical protein M0657_010353 [Pyricularia oryzae]KAI7922070.1 hypothetical protein M9X92_005060 [Pyricularia oryzae]
MYFSKLLLLVAEITAVAALPSPLALEPRQDVVVVKNGSFNEVMGLGRDLRINLIYPSGANGAVMVEYQHGKDRSLLTSQNRAPAPAPAGFFPLEPVSYRMTMEGTNGGSNFDFLKIDYILNADKVGKLNIRNGIFAKFNNGQGAFSVATDGPLEYVSNSERTMLSMDLGRKGSFDGEWGFFIPTADAIAGGLTTA